MPRCVADAGNDSFTDEVRPFLQRFCIDCHGADVQEADFRIDKVVGLGTATSEIERWENVFEMVSIGDMPPPGARQPTAEERTQFVDVLLAELRSIGHGPDERELAFPKYANRVNHDELFNGQHKGPAFTHSRVWRMSPPIYEELLQNLTLRDFTVPLSAMRGEGFADYALLYADESTIGTLMQNAGRVAMSMIYGQLVTPRGAALRDPSNKPHRKPTRHRVLAEFVKDSSPPTSTQLAEVVDYTFRTLLQRPPSADERERFATDLLARNIATGGRELGLRGFLVAVLLSSEYIFRMEVGLGEELPDGRRMLSSHELAYVLSYALYDHPVEAVFKNARDGQLTTKDDVERVVRLLLNSDIGFQRKRAANSRNQVWPVGKGGMDEADKPRMLRFFREFFGYAKATDVFKDDTRHNGTYKVKQIVDDADWFVLNTLANDRDVLSELLTSNRFFVAYRKSRNVSSPAVYNLQKEDWSKVESVQMPSDQRAGILTHPAWLAAHSGNFENDPVRRGRWIQEHLLAGVVPDIPIGVEAQLPDAPHQTLRERFVVVEDEKCWRCHRKMNPLGNPFEIFDDFGRYRKEHTVAEDGSVIASELELNGRRKEQEKLSHRPVDSSGFLSGTHDAAIDGEVADAIDLVHRLAGSDRVRQSFIRHVFRFWMGRNESLNDSPTLIAMDKAYVESNGSFKETLVSLFTSDSFLYRK